MKRSSNEVAVIKTTEGELVLEFWPDVAPGHVDNFKNAREAGLLRWHLLSSRHQGFHDPGRRSVDEGCGERIQLGHRRSGTPRQSGVQRSPARSRRAFHGPLARSQFGRQPVLHLPRATRAFSTASTPRSENSSKATTSWKRSPPPRHARRIGRSNAWASKASGSSRRNR